MKKILFLLGLVVILASFSNDTPVPSIFKVYKYFFGGNWGLTGAKNQWGNGMSFSSKSDAQLAAFTNASDTLLLQWSRTHSTLAIRNGVSDPWQYLAVSGSIDTATYARRAGDADSLNGVVGTAYLHDVTLQSNNGINISGGLGSGANTLFTLNNANAIALTGTGSLTSSSSIQGTNLTATGHVSTVGLTVTGGAQISAPLTVTGALSLPGTTSQYVRGDGSLASTSAIIVSGAVTTSGLTSGIIPKATGTNTLGNSQVTDDGTTVQIGGGIGITSKLQALAQTGTGVVSFVSGAATSQYVFKGFNLTTSAITSLIDAIGNLSITGGITTGGNIMLSDVGTPGNIQLGNNSGAVPTTPGSNLIKIFGGGSNKLSIVGESGFVPTIIWGGITANRNYTVQDGSGTLAFTSDVTGNEPFTRTGAIITAVSPGTNLTLTGTIQALAFTGAIGVNNSSSGTYRIPLISGTTTGNYPLNVSSVGPTVDANTGAVTLGGNMNTAGTITAGALSSTFLVTNNNANSNFTIPFINSTGTGQTTIFNSLGGATINPNTGNLTATTFTGQVITASQPNITSLGSLSVLTVSGSANITGTIETNKLHSTGSIKSDGNIYPGSNPTGLLLGDTTIGGQDYFIYTTGQIKTTSTIFGNLTGNVTGNVTGTILTAAQPNITSLGTLAALTSSGVINANGFVNNGVAAFYAAPGNGFSRSYASTTAGHVLTGQGSTYDWLVIDHGGNLGLAVPTGGSGTVAFFAPLQLPLYTVATLPTCGAGQTGQIAYITDGLAPSFLVAVVGGGTVKTQVSCNGTNWVAQSLGQLFYIIGSLFLFTILFYKKRAHNGYRIGSIWFNKE